MRLRGGPDDGQAEAGAFFPARPGSRASSRRAKRPKARSASSGGNPGPSSVTVSTAHPPSSRTDTHTRLAACLTALSSRFTSSLASASGSPATTHGPAVSARTGTRAVA